MKQTVYIETTVVSYLTAWRSRDLLQASHELLTRQWWTRERRRFELFTSQLVIEEASGGDKSAAADRLTILHDIPLLAIPEKMGELAGLLAAFLKLLPARARADAIHMAIAAVHRTSFLLTWNCRHLANAALADRIDRACENFGYPAPRMVTPEQLMERP